MRVNVYAEEMTNRVEIVEKETKDGKFTGLRIYLELPCTIPCDSVEPDRVSKFTRNVRGPFIHHIGDDDSSAVTFWGKHDLLDVLYKATDMLEKHYKIEREVTAVGITLRTDKEERLLQNVLYWAKDVVGDKNIWNSSVFPRKATLEMNDSKIVWDSINNLELSLKELEKYKQ